MNNRTRVCVVSPEIVGPHKNGGIGTHCYYLSAFLSQQLKQDVTFFHTGPIEVKDEAYWRGWFKEKLDVEYVSVSPNPQLAGTPPTAFKSTYAQMAREIYARLREGNFDVCHFQELLGNGFRCFQAKKMGLAFQNTILTCTVHSSWEWICQAMQSFPQHGLEELQTKYMERYCIENCDLLLSPSEYMLQWVDANRIKATAPRQVLPYLFDPALQAVGYKPTANHIIFFGRLEVRKGLLLFLQSLLELDRQNAFASQPLQVTFLGRSGYTPDGGGRQSIEKFQQHYSPNIRIRLETELGHREAMHYLTTHNDALVVCPSLVDNSPYAVIESLQLGLNIIAGRCGGIPELFAGTERLFDPNVASFCEKLKAGLKNELPAPDKRYDLKQAQKLWGNFCENLRPQQASAAHPKGSGHAKVHVYVGTTGSESALTATLQAMEGQKHQNFALTVVPVPGDSLQPAISPELTAYCRKRGWEVLNATAGNWAPETPYALLVLAGCSPAPEAVGQLIEAMECNTKADALTGFLDVSSDYNGKIAFSYEPLGPFLEGALHHNYFGSGCVMLRTARLPQSLPPLVKLVTPEGIWGLLSQLAFTGKNCDVFPAKLGAWKNPGHIFCFKDLDYGRFLPVIDSYTAGQSPWLRYLFLYEMAKEAKVLRAEEERLAHTDNTPKPKLTVGKKIRRETKRIIRQAQGLFSR